MKKMMIFLVLGMFLLSFASFAIAEGQQNSNDSLREQVRENIQERQELREKAYELKQEIRENIQERQELKQEFGLRVKNHTARTTMNITEEVNEDNETVLKVQMSNGNSREIKIMPDTAAERAIERLRLKVCNETNNCTIELKETGTGNQIRATYEIQVQRHYRILGLFKAKAQNQVQIDAENGEVIQEKKPWWSFLASKQD